MSDFLTELRGELLDAHAAERRRGGARRAGRAFVAGAPSAAVAVAAVAALVVAIVGVRAVIPPPSAAPRVVDVVRVGGNLTDAVVAVDGSVWVSDFAGRRVTRLDAASRRVVERVQARGQPVAMAAGVDGTWVRGAVGDGGAISRVGSAAATQVGYGSTLAAAPGVVWAADVELPPEGLRRIDAGTGRDAGLLDVVEIYALAVGGESLWAVTTNGTVLRLDARTGERRSRWPALAISPGTAAPALVADAKGAWVLKTGQGTDSRAIRLEDDRIARRLPLPPSARPLLARAPDGLWTVTEDPVRYRTAAVRLDPETGEVTARVALGGRNPTALLSVDDEIWIAGSDGTIAVVGAD